MSTFPAVWDGGFEWGPVETPGTEAVWGPVAPPASGPVALPHVAIGGRPVRAQVQGANWGAGRSGWFSTLSPSSATVTFDGVIEAEPAESMIIITEQGTAWAGRVDTSTTDEQPGGLTTTTVTGTDLVGLLGQAKLSEANIASGTLIQQVTAIGALAGIPVSITTAPSVGSLPTLLALNPFSGSALEAINRIEQSSNAALFLMPDGTMTVLVRDALPDEDVEVLPLDGADSPASWSKANGLTDVVNAWVLTKEDGTVVLNDTSRTDSIAKYGLRAHEVTGYLSNSASHFGTGLRDALAIPRATVPMARSPLIRDHSQGWLRLRPLDWVSREDELWQVLQVQHEVQPGSWRITIAADQTQNAIVGGAQPEPEEPDEPGTHIETETIVITKDATLFKSSSGGNYGGGADPMAPVGRWQGNIMRLLLQASMTKPSGYRGVKRARLRGRTSNQTRVAFGSKPKVIVQRVNGPWQEGTDDGTPYTFANAVVFPGPPRVSNGQVTKAITRSTNTDQDIVVTEIVRAQLAGTNYGFCILSANEGSNTNTTEFHSSDGAREWRLIIDWIVED